MDSLSLSGMRVTALGVGQENGVIMVECILVRIVVVGDGRASWVAISILVGLCAVSLAVMARVLARSGTGLHSREGIGVRSNASAPPLGPDSKGGLATPTPVGWCLNHQLGWPSSA